MSGERFDLATGLPESWSTPEAVTWWAWSREWLALKWPQWSGHSRRSAVESLVALTPRMVVSRAGPPPDDLDEWMRSVGYRPGGPDHPWLARWSVPLTDIDAPLIERVLTAATTKRDGSTMSAEVVRRRRTTLGAVLRSAVRRGLLDANPLDRVEWRPPERSTVGRHLHPAGARRRPRDRRPRRRAAHRRRPIRSLLRVDRPRWSAAIRGDRLAARRSRSCRMRAGAWPGSAGPRRRRAGATPPEARARGEGAEATAKGRHPGGPAPGPARAAPPMAHRPMAAGRRSGVHQRRRPPAEHDQLRPGLEPGTTAAVADRPPIGLHDGLRPPALGRHDDAPGRRPTSRGRPPARPLRGCPDAVTPASSPTSVSAPTA